MLSYNELKPGAVFVKDSEPYEVLESEFLRMQQRKPVMRLKIKNLISGKFQDFTAHQNESFEEAEIETETANFIYSHRGEYWFSNPKEPKNRFVLKNNIVGNSGQYLKAQTEVQVFKFKEKIIGLKVPVKMDFKVIEASPAVKGDTAQGGSKTVILETGAKVSTPLFINEGDVVKVNTETGAYVERVLKTAA